MEEVYKMNYFLKRKETKVIRKASLSIFKSNTDSPLVVRVWRQTGGQKHTLVSMTDMVPFRKHSCPRFC